MSKKVTKETLRNKCDKLLQDYIRAKYGKVLCYLCGNRYSEVGHHFVYKSQSNACRFYLPNIIPLCMKCHFDIHCHPSMNDAKITLKMGKEWYDDLEELKHQSQKFNKDWVESNFKLLTALLEETKHEEGL